MARNLGHDRDAPVAVPQPLTRVLCPPLGLLPPDTAPDLITDALKYFQSISWCSELLAGDPNAPNWVGETIPFIPQGLNPASPEHDQFIGVTLGIPTALRHGICFFRPADAQHVHDPDRPINEVSSLYSLGNGLCGFKGILHGGMVMTLLDEALGIVVEINAALGKKWASTGGNMVTGSLSVKFLRPVPVNSEVCVYTLLEAVEGRKAIIKAELLGSKGEVMAMAESIWVKSKANM